MTTAATPRIVSLTLAQIVPHPRNVRHTLTDLAPLAASIKEDGILQPLVVAPGDTKGTYVLIAGHRRHAAAGKAGLHELPCLVRDDLTDKADQLQAMLTENLQRTDLNPIEEGDAFQELLDLGIKPAVLAKRTGRTAKLIRTRVKIASGPAELRDRVIAREVTLDEALILEGFSKYSEIYDQLSQYVGTRNWSWAVGRAKEDTTHLIAVTKRTKELTAGGVQVLDDDGLEEHRLRAEAVGLDRVWQKLDERPDDATSEDVAVTFPFRNPDKVQWHRLVDATVAAGASSPKKPAGKKTTTAVDAATDRDLEADRARVEADIAAANQLAADLKTATPVRRAHLKNSISNADTDIAAECLRRLLASQLGFLDADQILIFAGIAGLNPDTVSDNDLELWAYSLTVNQLAVALRVADSVESEESLEQLTGWQYRSYLGKNTAPWRDELGTTFGYEWSDVEADLLTQFATDAAKS